MNMKLNFFSMRLKLTSTVTQKVVTLMLLAIPWQATAQTGHWRLGFQAGTANTRSEFSITPAMPDKQLNVTTPVGLWWQANLERSISSHLSIRLGAGQIRLPYTIANTVRQLNASGQIVQAANVTFGRADRLTYGSLGLTANSSAWGPLIVTAGVDLTLRYNPEAKTGRPYGGWSRFSLVSGPDSLGASQSTSFIPQPVSTFTVSVAPRLGVDIRVSKRAFISALATYNLGLGTIHRAPFTSDLNGQPYSGFFTHKGSFMGYQAGIKYALGQVKPMSRLQYTAYNRPEPKVAWYQEEKLRTFRKGSWLMSGRAAYFSERSSNGFDLSAQVQGGYFVADRLALGLKGKYIRDYRSATFPVTRSWLLGPVVRYHLSRSRIAPFVEGGYQLGRVHFDATATNVSYPPIQETVRVLSLAGGVSARLSQTLRLDITAETQQFSYYPIPRKTAIRPEIGLTYYLRK